MDVGKGTAKGAGICGIILLVCGVSSSISGFYWTGFHGSGGHGIWSGIGLVVAGILGVIVWWKRSKGVLIGFLVVTIIMIWVASIQAMLSGGIYRAFKVGADPGRCYPTSTHCVCQHGFDTQYYDRSFCDRWEALGNSLLVITIFNVIGVLICFVGSIFGCIGACCATTQGQTGTVVVQQPAVDMHTTTQHHYVAQQPGYAQQPGNARQPARVVLGYDFPNRRFGLFAW